MQRPLRRVALATKDTRISYCSEFQDRHLEKVVDGGSLLPAVSREDNAGFNSQKPDLTSRQREVLRLIALGSSAKDIANHLNISVRTAEFHRAAIMQRLGLHSTAQMTRYALANYLG